MIISLRRKVNWQRSFQRIATSRPRKAGVERFCQIEATRCEIKNKFCLARANKKRCCIFEFAELSTENYREKRQGKAILFEFSIFCVRKKRNIEQTKVAKWYYNVMKSIHKLLKAIFGTHGEIGKYLWHGKSGRSFGVALSNESERD